MIICLDVPLSLMYLTITKFLSVYPISETQFDINHAISGYSEICKEQATCFNDIEPLAIYE